MHGIQNFPISMGVMSMLAFAGSLSPMAESAPSDKCPLSRLTYFNFAFACAKDGSLFVLTFETCTQSCIPVESVSVD